MRCFQLDLSRHLYQALREKPSALPWASCCTENKHAHIMTQFSLYTHLTVHPDRIRDDLQLLSCVSCIADGTQTRIQETRMRRLCFKRYGASGSVRCWIELRAGLSVVAGVGVPAPRGIPRAVKLSRRLPASLRRVTDMHSLLVMAAGAWYCSQEVNGLRSATLLSSKNGVARTRPGQEAVCTERSRSL